MNELKADIRGYRKPSHHYYEGCRVFAVFKDARTGYIGFFMMLCHYYLHLKRSLVSLMLKKRMCRSRSIFVSNTAKRIIVIHKTAALKRGILLIFIIP